MIRTNQPFASFAKGALILLLLFSFVLISQQSSKSIYQFGLLLLIVLTLLQIAFGNIPATATFKQSMLYLGIAAIIITALVLLAIWLAPSLILLGR